MVRLRRRHGSDRGVRIAGARVGRWLRVASPIATNESGSIAGVIAPDRRTWLTPSALALACVASVWPILASQSIPAFKQDWAWPLSRAQAWEWFHTFVGLWDGRGTAHANL